MRRLLASLLLAAQGAAAEPPARIASFSPAATRILFDLGQSHRLVAGTRWCDLPANAGLPRVCDAFQPEIERLASLRPDVVVLPRLANPLLADRLRSAGLRVHLLASESADSPAEDILSLARLTESQSKSETLLAARRQLRPSDGRKVLLVWDGVVAGPDSYLAWVIAAAGGRPAPREGAWLDWNPETAALTNPDIVLYLVEGSTPEPTPSKRGLEEWKSRPGMRTTTCASKGYIFEMHPSSDWLPASGLPKAAATLAKLMDSAK